ncbi:MAG: TIGR03862 family flavoprotein, partial [Paracoccaceae bacterium]
MAAVELAQAGRHVLLADAKPSVGRKLLMAGRSGLNLTKDEPFAAFLQNYGDSAGHLREILTAFDNEAVKNWAESLDQPVFTGSTGRVFPKTMKSSPLLRAWLAQLSQLGVEVKTRWQWQGWHQDSLRFLTPDGEKILDPKVIVLALGGASWSRLGSDGAWAPWLAENGVGLAAFAPANAGVTIKWSDHMTRHFGAPIKGVSLKAGAIISRGEFVITQTGLEGGGIYSVFAAIRDGARLQLDLLPDWTEQRIMQKLAQKRRKTTTTNHLRKTLRLDPVKLALLMEFGRPLPAGQALAQLIKYLPVTTTGLAPIDRAISTAGGVLWDAVDASLMLRTRPGVFAAGEMLDWEAPTGGYLLTACLATGKWAGKNAANWAKATSR